MALPVAADANWPGWRGPHSDGSAVSGEYPVEWNPENVLWKTAVPGKGFSTPVVWDKTIFLTTGAEGLDTLLALDWSGEKIWEKQLGAESAGKHRNGSGSNPSATTDGSAVFVFFKSGTLAAFEFDGAVRWQTNLFERYGRDDR
jgi:outer membrane protein assembly factor BamB